MRRPSSSNSSAADVIEMTRSCSSAIQSDVACRRALRPLTAPASSIAPAYSSSFSVSVVLPASGCEMIANVRRLETSRSSSVSSADAGSMLRLYRDSFRHIKNVSETAVSRFVTLQSEAMSVLSRRVLSLGLVVPMLLMAQQLARADEDETAAAARQSPRTIDVGDLWRMLLHRDETPEDATKKFFVLAPSIGSKPSTGLTAGVSGNIAFYLGDPATTRISSISGGLKVSQKKQEIGGVKYATFTNGDRWFFQGDNRMSWTSQNTYGLGGDTLTTNAENVKYDLFRF